MMSLQLWLVFERAVAPVKVWVIESVGMPTEN